MTCNTPYYATIVTTNVVMTITTITCNIHCYTHHHQDQIVISPSPSPVDSTFNLTTHLPSHHNNRTPNLLPQKQISSQKLTARRKLLQKLLTTSESSIIPSTQKRVLSNNESSTIVSTQVKSSHNASKPNLMGPSIVVLGYDSNDHGCVLVMMAMVVFHGSGGGAKWWMAVKVLVVVDMCFVFARS